jgi:hypothetical protein
MPAKPALQAFKPDMYTNAAGMSTKLSSAIAKIKLAWSLRNFFRATQSIMPPEDIGEAAASGAMQEGPTGAINEAIGQAGGMAGHALGERAHMPALGAMMGNLGAKAGAEQFIEPKIAAAKDVMKAAIKRLHVMHKKAEQGRDGLSTNDDDVDAGQGERSANLFSSEQHDGNDAAPETNPVVQVPQDLQPNPVDEIMAMIQKGNEADFHQTRADEATQALDAAEERASMLEGQLQQLIQELDAAKSEGMGQAQMSGEQAAASAQEAMMARNESLAAQQQALALRQAITSYRQGLMDMLAQDPTAAVGPPPVPVAPLPGQDPNAGAGGPPGAAAPGGMAPTTEAQPAPPPEAAGGPPGGPPMAPDAGAAPGGPSAAPSAGGGGSGAPVNIHIQQPKASAPKAAKPPSPGSKE